MNYKQGDIVLIKFPFTTLSKSKKRPVLIIKDENKYGDFVCFQITSKSNQTNLYALDNSVFIENSLSLASYVKYDKCFTLNTSIIDKKLTSINKITIEEIKKLFCNEI